MSAVILPLFVMLKRRDKLVKLPIDRKQLLRLPGYGLQEEISDKQFDLVGHMLMGIFLVISPFAYFTINAFVSSGYFPYTHSFLIAVALAIVAWRTIKTFNHLTKLRLGHTAELATAGELLQLQAKGYQVFHDIQADKFNIDHLAIGPNGVFAIETKGRHKRHADASANAKAKGVKGHEVVYKSGKLEFPSWVEVEPIEQAKRQAKWVSQWLSTAAGIEVKAVPVLVFPGWYVSRGSRVPFPILNHKQLAITLPKSGNTSYSQEQINAIAYQVAQRAVQGERDK
ncbi:nuclease-related domain-containing protein [Lacimicrobium sp. SS2-24]|uniref:nuclease-related domain-containing protein n=1 Tax=Lacimicrobium sp. SS2-24 TaxID=2005569 RepID=UPI001FEEEE8A|nr:nuclease-related domain-containing protein [Lacimicrobium sp. SS2-24]